MAIHDLPGIGLKGGFPLGYDGWDTDMNNSLRKLSALVQCKVLDRVASLPGSPTDGDMYIVTSGANANAVAVRDEGAWYYLAPFLGWRVYDATFGGYVTFDGSVWVEESASAAGGLETIASVDMTGATTVDFAMPSGYRYFELVARNVRFSAASRVPLLYFGNGSSFPGGVYSCLRGISFSTSPTMVVSYSVSSPYYGVPLTGSSRGLEWSMLTGTGANGTDLAIPRFGPDVYKGNSTAVQFPYFNGIPSAQNGSTYSHALLSGVYTSGYETASHCRIAASSTGNFTQGTATLYGMKE